MFARPASPTDADAIARIWTEGIEDRVATFETNPQDAAAVQRHLADGRPAVVAEREGTVQAFAWVTPYSGRHFYSGVGECSIYVSRDARGAGLGKLALGALITLCTARGYWKLTGKVLAGNAASLGLLGRAGFRTVGTHLRHGQLDGKWLDVVLVELFIQKA